MAIAVRHLSRLQVARETARGAAVAPTRRLNTRSARQTVETTLDDFSDEDSGTIAGAYYPPVVTGRGTMYTIEQALDLRAVLLPLLGGLEGQDAATVTLGNYSEAPGITTTAFEVDATTSANALTIVILQSNRAEMVVTGNAATRRGLREQLQPGRPVQIVLNATPTTAIHSFTVTTVSFNDSGANPVWTVGMSDEIPAATLTTAAALAVAAKGGDHQLRFGTGTWEFSPSTKPIAAEEPDTFTLEYVEASGAEDYGRRSAYGFVESVSFRAEPDGTPGVTVTMRARRSTEAAEVVELPPFRLPTANPRWRLYDDATWAGLGTTRVENQVISFTFGLATGIEMQPSLEGRDDLDFSSAQRTALRVATLSAQLVVDPSSTAYVRACEGRKESRTPRFVRAAINGPPLYGGMVRASLQLDGCYVHTAESVAERGDRNANRMVRTVNFSSMRDIDSERDLGARLVTDVGAF